MSDYRSFAAQDRPARSPQVGSTLVRRIAGLQREHSAEILESLLRDTSSTQDLLGELGALLGMSLWRTGDAPAWISRFDLLAFAEANRRGCALVQDAAGTLHLLVTDPFDTDQIAWATTRFGAPTVHLVDPQTWGAWMAQAEAGMSALGAIDVLPDSVTRSSAGAAEHLSLSSIDAHESPAVRFVNSTLYDALKTGASDIHLESDPKGMVVKFRLDGVLTFIRRVDSTELASQAISRIKVMAQLDIAERRVPQDGRLQISFKARSIDVRVSIMPSIHGEDAVLRILDREHLARSLAGLTLANLGFSDSAKSAIHALCRKPHGMFLLTGPTGSGKTTTLYAAISETHETRDKIITIEDPVEYQLPGVLQIPVNERKGLSFARGLRSILRHDPDKILVGEIRDAETALIAVQSALTGHLVFTTVHANTVFDVVGRFEQFGIDAYTFSSAINGVLAQRLLRRLCTECAAPGPERAPAAGEAPDRAPHYLVARGCDRCRGTGYIGRFAIGELLTLTPDLKALVARRAPQQEIQSLAATGGWESLRSQALAAAAHGLTSIEEVDRVAP